MFKHQIFLNQYLQHSNNKFIKHYVFFQEYISLHCFIVRQIGQFFYN